jgi:protein arginine kinase activator
MKTCQSCNNRPATVHFTQVVNGEKTELRLCEACARERGDIGLLDFPGGGFNINGLLAGLMNAETLPHGGSLRQESACATCGANYSRFAEGGRLGCAECYSTFSRQLAPLLKRIHGNAHHAGKIPSRGAGEIRRKRELARLRAELRAAVDSEQYERAVELRDQIRTLECEV